MKINTKYLYDLLPAYYRVIDEDQGNQLEAFIGLLAREGGIVEDNIAELYENWFIETCDEWVVPYIGDLLGVKGVHEIDNATIYSRRAYIANTLAYRRRKGTAPIIEQLALDITGWRSKVVEFFQLLSTAQNLNHVRLHNTVTPDLRKMNALDLINTAFDKQSHTIDVRRIETTGLGLYNIMNLGVYLWRLVSYPIENADARLIPAAVDVPDAAYTFSQLGLDTHLFNNPQTEKKIEHLAKEINVPGLLRRRALYDELDNAYQALVNGGVPDYTYFDEAYPPVFQLFLNGSTTPIPLEEIVICNLSSWRLPATSINYKKYELDGSITIVPKNITAAVDPVLGRITFADPTAVSEVSVNYSYGFSGDLGGGPYDRKVSLLELENLNFDWHVGVSKDHAAVGGETIHQTLRDAIGEWNSLPVAMNTGLITIMDNRTYKENLSGIRKIKIDEGKRLFIIAAEWPVKDDPSGVPGVKHRPHGSYNPEDVRPHILGAIVIEGTAPAGLSSGGGLLLNGLIIDGKVNVLNGNLNSLQLNHCTITPYKEGIEIALQQSILNLSLERSISGSIHVMAEDATVTIDECIVDNKAGYTLSVPNGQLAIEKSTIYGEVESQSLDAGNSIFMNELKIERRQFGCVRFSYIPNGSETPRRYRCQPELEIQTQIKELEKQAQLNGVVITNAERQAIKDQIFNWLFPVFNAKSYGHHAYAQLGNATSLQITTGGDDGSEMGAFNYLQQPQREANLNTVLTEYVRLGLEAGIIYVT